MQIWLSKPQFLGIVKKDFCSSDLQGKKAGGDDETDTV